MLNIPDGATVDDVVAELRRLPPLTRARLARLIADRRTARRVSEVGDAAVFGMTRERTYAEVAGDLGVSKAAVNKAVTAHLALVRAGETPDVPTTHG